jgi:CNT family concentrative nucleoside transporter
MQLPDELPAEPPATGPELPAPSPTASETAVLPKTPLAWRLYIAAALLGLFFAASWARETIGLRGQSLAGIFFFFGIVALFSTNLRAVNWRTIGWGIALQLLLALLVLQGKVTVGGHEYAVYGLFECLGDVVRHFLGYSNQGADFVFGNLAHPDQMQTVFGSKYVFPFAFVALPTILFVSAFFTVLYHFGILQACVHGMAKMMVLTMKSWKALPDYMSPRSYQLAAYALTGFANFSSVGIQLGGIGALAPDRRHDLARLGMKALFVGFVATLLNASVAGLISDLAK